MMKRLLGIKRSATENMPTFSENLRKGLEGIGLDYLGLMTGHEEETHAFESPGEGGFIIYYQEDQRFKIWDSNNIFERVDAIITPIGVTTSLIQRTYGYLKRLSEDKGYKWFGGEVE